MIPICGAYQSLHSKTNNLKIAYNSSHLLSTYDKVICNTATAGWEDSSPKMLVLFLVLL